MNIEDLGYEKLRAMLPDEMETLVRSTLDETPDHHHVALKNAVCQLGEAAFDALPLDKQRRLRLFVIGGCCGHKDGNASEGEYKAMHDIWPTLDAPPPILLANKDNAATIALGKSSDSGAVLRATKSSESGGPKFLSPTGGPVASDYCLVANLVNICF